MRISHQQLNFTTRIRLVREPDQRAVAFLQHLWTKQPHAAFCLVSCGSYVNTVFTRV